MIKPASAVSNNPLPGLSISIKSLTATSEADEVKAAQELLREYGEFVLASTGPARFCAARLEGEILHPVESYVSNGGELFLAFSGNEAAGCAGYRALHSGVPGRACELKRMWVRPRFRGAAIGRLLAQTVFERASAAGYKAIYLDTEPHAMPAALRLYQQLGFEECPPYSSQQANGLRFFRRALP